MELVYRFNIDKFSEVLGLRGLKKVISKRDDFVIDALSYFELVLRFEYSGDMFSFGVPVTAIYIYIYILYIYIYKIRLNRNYLILNLSGSGRLFKHIYIPCSSGTSLKSSGDPYRCSKHLQIHLQYFVIYIYIILIYIYIY